MYRRVERLVTFAAPSASFSMYLGNDVDVYVTIQDFNGQPVDLTGYIVDWVLKSTTILLRKKSYVSPKTLLILEQTDYPGVIMFNIAATDTVPAIGTPFAAGDYVQEMAITDTAAKKTTVLTGTVTLLGVSL